MSSSDDGPFSRFRRPRDSAASWHGAALAGLLLLPTACDHDEVAHDPVAPSGDAGVSALPDEALNGPNDADAGVPPVAPDAPPAGIGRVPDVASGGSAASDMLALGVLERLEALCGACHSNGDNGAGFSNGMDLGGLIDTGLIVPGQSASSPLLARILDGSMPPVLAPAAQLPRIGAPTVGDIALLADFIDQLATEPLPRCEPLPFLGLDDVFAMLLSDVQSRPADERVYLRYVSLAGASNARLCGPALDQQRQALFKLVNSLSMQSEIRLPVAIDGAELLYRIDLRDYGWDRELDLDGDGAVDAPDGWEAALSVVPHGVAFGGPEASALSAETGAAVPLSGLPALTRAAADGDVYRGLLGVPANVYDMQLSLGVDAALELEDGDTRRAGFVRYPPYGSETVATRLALGELGQRAYWWLDADEEPYDSSTIYADPLGFVGGPWLQTLWELPNGLHGYLLNGSDGGALSGTTSSCGGTCVRPEQQHAVGCMGCHAGGLRPLRDSIRAYAERYPTQFDMQSFNDILTIYPPRPSSTSSSRTITRATAPPSPSSASRLAPPTPSRASTSTSTGRSISSAPRPSWGCRRRRWRSTSAPCRRSRRSRTPPGPSSVRGSMQPGSTRCASSMRPRAIVRRPAPDEPPSPAPRRASVLRERRQPAQGRGSPPKRTSASAARTAGRSACTDGNDSATLDHVASRRALVCRASAMAPPRSTGSLVLVRP